MSKNAPSDNASASASGVNSGSEAAAILLADSRGSTGNASLNATSSESVLPSVSVAQNTNRQLQALETAEVISAVTGNPMVPGYGMPGYGYGYGNGYGNGYGLPGYGGYGFQPNYGLQPGLGGVGGALYNNLFNQGRANQNPGAIIFPRDGDGNLINPATRQPVPINGDANYLKLDNPKNPLYKFDKDDNGNPIDPDTDKVVPRSDPRYNDPTNPVYFLRDPVTGYLINPLTGQLLTPPNGAPNNRFNPPNGAQPINPSNPNNGFRPTNGSNGGAGGGGNFLGGLLRIGLMVGLFSLLGRIGGGGGSIFASALPFLLFGGLSRLGGGGYNNGGGLLNTNYFAQRY